MILGILFSSLKSSELWVYLINMDKRTQDLTKMHGSASLPLGHEILAEQPQWSRCNSFSSCSNDSSVFCSSRPSQNSIFQADKHLINDAQHSSHLPKRNRNSSGSSVSSTVSSASDRDTKNTSVIITSTSLPQVVNTEIRSESLSRLACPEINPSSFNLQHEALLSCSGSPNSALPFRHNLRRKIRKKTCNCDCTTSCTTLVVRRYKEENLEEETVISSTKVQTCVQNNAAQAIHNVSFEKSFSSEKTENNRKRRSEVEKLYDSLHEIKWAKNFSPDNILRQLNIRQAASCSLFGRPSPSKSSSTFSRPSKKQKMDSDQLSNPSSDQSRSPSNDQSTSLSNDQSIDLPNFQSTSPCNSEASSDKKKSNRIVKNHVRTNLTLRSHSKIAASKKVDSSPTSTNASKRFPSKSLKTSNVLESEERVKNFSPVKREHNSVKNCIGSSESSSIKHENSVEKRENEKSSKFTKAESPSVPINYLLNLKGNSDIEIDCPNIVSEYPSAFYDIAEEGIRTIDACFREVGAEVVVSTCCDKDNDLPRLTAVRDNVLDKCSPIDDGPPVLEPCVSLQDRVRLQNIECKVASDFPVSDKSDAALKYMYEKNIHCSPKRKGIIFTRNSLQESPIIDEDQNHDQSVNVLKKLRTNFSRHVDNSLVKDACKKISNKYLKLLRSKSRTLSFEKPSKVTKIEESSSILPIKRAIVPTVIENKPLCQDNRIASHSSAISHFPFDSKELSFRTAGENAQTTTILQTSNKRVSYSNFPERIAFNQSASNSFMYSNDKESFSHVSTSSKNLANQSVIVEESSTNFLHVQHTPLPPVISTTYVPIKNAIKGKKTLKEVPRPPAASFTCHYQTIKVNRQNSYTQVQLKLNRGCSIFLTVETLTEMKDVLHRTSQDTNCHILILNGIGDSFCLGLDLLPLLGPQKIKASTEIAVAVKEFIEELSSFKKPFVAVVNGSAYGLGMTILNHADICIASDTAKFCLPQTSLGYFPEGGATLTLPQAVGSTMAMDLILRGRTITAHEAKSIGLVSEVMEAKYLPYDLVTRVKVLAENSQTGMETAKAMLKMRLHVELLMVLENEVKLLPKMWLSRSCQEAIQNTSHTWLFAE